MMDIVLSILETHNFYFLKSCLFYVVYFVLIYFYLIGYEIFERWICTSNHKRIGNLLSIFIMQCICYLICLYFRLPVLEIDAMEKTTKSIIRYSTFYLNDYNKLLFESLKDNINSLKFVEDVKKSGIYESTFFHNYEKNLIKVNENVISLNKLISRDMEKKNVYLLNNLHQKFDDLKEIIERLKNNRSEIDQIDILTNLKVHNQIYSDVNVEKKTMIDERLIEVGLTIDSGNQYRQAYNYYRGNDYKLRGLYGHVSFVKAVDNYELVAPLTSSNLFYVPLKERGFLSFSNLDWNQRNRSFLTALPYQVINSKDYKECLMYVEKIKLNNVKPLYYVYDYLINREGKIDKEEIEKVFDQTNSLIVKQYPEMSVEKRKEITDFLIVKLPLEEKQQQNEKTIK